MEEVRVNYIQINDAGSTVVSANSDPQDSPQGGESLLNPDQHIKTEFAEEPHWENLPSMINTRSKFCSATHNNRIYVFGGVLNQRRKKVRGGRTTKAEMFDPQTNSWTELPNMPHPKCNFSCAVVGDNIHLIAGEKESSRYQTHSCEVFNTKTLTWSNMTSMKLQSGRHSSVAIGNLIYVFGGFRTRGSTDVYDTVTRKWTRKSNMVVDRYSFASAVINNKIYAIGGMKEYPPGNNRDTPQYHRYLETMEEYDIETDTWTISQEKMGNRRAGCSAVVVGSTIKVFGGFDEKGSVSSVESFDTIQQKWSGSFIPPSKSQRKHFALERIEDSLILIGGMDADDSNVLLNTVERYSLPKSPTINLNIPAINKLTNINEKMISPQFTEKKRKRSSTSIKSSKRELRQLETKVNYKFTKDVCRKGTRRNIKKALRQTNKKKQPRNKSVTVKKNVKRRCSLKGTRTAKYVEDSSSQGSVHSSDDEDSKFPGVSGGNFEESDEEGVEMETQDYHDGTRKEKKKRKKFKGGGYKESEKRTAPKRGNGVDKNIYLSLMEKIESQSERIKQLEIEILGKTQKGSLQDRSDELKDALTKMEKQAFGKAQTGEFQDRFENLKSFSSGSDLL